LLKFETNSHGLNKLYLKIIRVRSPLLTKSPLIYSFLSYLDVSVHLVNLSQTE